MKLEPGQQIGTLRIERELGRGAYGVVCLARDTLLGREVALKILPGGQGEVAEELREQVLHEARLIANLQSPHIVTFYRLHETEDGGFLQEMEYVVGGSLEDRLKEGAPLPLDEAVSVFRGVCRALGTAHAARIIHGDIKPANVLFGDDDLVKLADFGVARMIEGTGTSIELKGQLFGSPLYMAPEVITGRAAGMASDLWSASVLFYRLLTGRLPFVATTFGELLPKILSEEPEPINSGAPEALGELVARCLVKEAEGRPSSVSEVLEELDRLSATDVRLGPAPSVREHPTNLVPPASSFVGREREISEITELLGDEEVRLVTLTGPGGIGKTRISLEICRRLLDRFEGGCWFVDLSEVQDADGIGHAVAAALGVRDAGEKDPGELVAGVLQFRKPLLLVLDNFEQILKFASETVALWRERAPDVRFFVTSRALLALSGERRYELLPLPAQAEGEVAGDTDGVRLFVDRAREASPGFALSESNVGDVVRIVRELNGMPLAIELAAARARIMQPEKIAEKLGQKFQLLRSTRLDVTVRQQSLMGAIEWSYDLLSDWEKDAYLQACYFRDGLSLGAAEAVIDLSGFPGAPPAMEVAQSLRDKSLFTAYDAGPETRLSMYRAIREFGEKRWQALADGPRRGALAGRHADYYLAFAEEWNRKIPGFRDQEAFDRISLELGNLSAVQAFALESKDGETAARAALAVAETIKVRRPPRQLLGWLERAVAALGDEPTELGVRLGAYHTVACRMSGDWDRAVESARSSVAAGRAVGAPEALTAALLEQAEILRNRGDLDEALAAFVESEELAKETGNRHSLALSIGGRGLVLWQKVDFDAAYRCFCEAESLAREIGDFQVLALNIHNRGVIYEKKAELDAAISCHREAEDVSRRIGNRVRVAVSLGARANVNLHAGTFDAAHGLYLEAEEIARELGDKQRISQLLSYRGAMHKMKGEIDDALECYIEAEALARELGDKRQIAILLGQRARAHEAREEIEAAIECYGEAKEISEEIGDRLVTARNLCNRGSLLLELEREEEACEALRAGLRICDEMNAGESIWYFAFKAELAQAESERGRIETARRLAGEGLALAAKLKITEEHQEPGVREALGVFRGLHAK